MESIIVCYKCYECGFNGEVKTKNNKVTCPSCGVKNDIWNEHEKPSLRHKMLQLIFKIKNKIIV